MRLWRRNEAPVGGWHYILDDGQRVPRGGFATGLQDLITQVESAIATKGQEVPAYLGELVEDQICTRQPSERCRYSKKLGDQIARGIHGALEAVDSVLQTNFAPKARKCGKCGQRRTVLNNI